MDQKRTWLGWSALTLYRVVKADSLEAAWAMSEGEQVKEEAVKDFQSVEFWVKLFQILIWG